MNKKYALDNLNLNNIKAQIKKADNVLFFLDYDGTLAPFQPDPLSAFALPEIETNLKELEKKEAYYLSLVSGRKLAELKKMIDLKRSNFAGSHGLEIELFFSEGVIYPYQTNEIDVLSKKNYQKSKEKYLAKAGVRLEDKGFGFALHFESEQKQLKAEKDLKALFKNTAYQVLAGRKIVEIRPAGWDKGQAVKYISNQINKKLGIDNTLQIYIGDDSTDEDAFRVIENGITIYVKNEDDLSTEAEYYLYDPEDTAELLGEIAGEN
ncbi:trehalose-phosphatase [Halanaerobium saccharolyticum]|jgi:trehalose 6-phosphate phosphatase|uniref:trehalose-phosphatase n=1 Tax=Halanaerobium saccharolyticum TaxID=43595 RepID=UPI003FCD8B43